MKDLTVIDNICLISECNDRAFHQTRVMLTTFIHHNKWFNGKIIILVLESDPLSNTNLNIIKLMYDNIEILVIPDSDIIDLKHKVDSRKGLVNILDYLKVFAFKIKSKGNIYISKNVATTGDISEILNNNTVSIASTSDNFPGVGSNIDANMMFIPENYINDDVFNMLYSKLIGSILNGTFEFINTFEIESGIQFNRLPSSILVNASIFPNNKYANFIRYSKSIGAIIVDISTLSSAKHTRMQTYWNQLMHRSQQVLNDPRHKNIQNALSGAISKPNNDAPPSKATRYDISKLNLRSGDNISHKNYAVCTICDDKFIPGLLTMIHSFTRHNKWFNKEIIVLYDDVYSKINDDNKKLVHNVYHNIVFKKVNSNDYSKLIELFKASSNGKDSILRLVPSLFTFDIFEISDDYDTLVYLDADMLILDDISELFSINDANIIVTPDAGEYDINRNYNVFNGGFMVINSDGDMAKHKSKLIEHACNMKSMVLADQTIMNKYFDNRNIVYLTGNYNCLKRCFPDTRFKSYNNNIKIIHYVGAKPWISTTIRQELIYKNLEKMWFDEYNNISVNNGLYAIKDPIVNEDIIFNSKAVFVHLYYQDLWQEIKNKLQTLPFEYDLYVSICSEHVDEISSDILKFNKNSIIKQVENRGADYGGFFELLNISFDNNSEYDWILKIHGKKSALINPVKGERWRNELINTLIPNNFTIISNKMLDHSIGMIGPKSYLMSQTSFDARAGKSVNQENIDEFRARYNISDNTLKFFAGSMFWIKYDILKSTFNNDRITQYDFGKGHSPDGTKAHAMERFMANIVREKNLNVIGI